MPQAPLAPATCDPYANLPYANLAPETRAFLAQGARRGLFIGGSWMQGCGAQRLAVRDPATGQPITEVACATAQDIDTAVGTARQALESGPWSRLSPPERSAILLRIADGLTANATLLSELETLDNGMPLPFAQAMVSGAAALFRYYAGWCGKVYGDSMEVDTWDPADEVTAFTRLEPVGVVGQILPWNFPLAICAMKLAPALAAGCCVVVKPAEETPLTALALAAICQEAGLPDGVLSLLPGLGPEAGAALASHRDVDKISFTGSTEVGRLILSLAGGNMKKVALELGGKSPFLVLPDADIAKAAQTAVSMGFANQGQNCVSAARILVHEEVAEAFTAQVLHLTKALDVGPGLSGAAVGPLVSEAQRARVQGFIAEGIREGAILATGGDAPEGPGFFLRPAVFTGVRGDMRIVREEIFGPVLCIETFETRDIEDLAALANDTPYGLLASVWTQNLSIAHKLARRIRAGTVSINAHAHPGNNAPFGGYKQSGWGREFGRPAVEAYLETKTLAIHA